MSGDAAMSSGAAGASAGGGSFGNSMNSIGDSLSSFGHDLIHGGGSSKLSNQDITQLSGINNLMKDPSVMQDKDMLASLADQKNSLLNRDNGGYLGALGRMASGSGQNMTENLGGAALKGIMAIIQQQAMKDAYSKNNQVMSNALGQSVQQQRNMLTGGNF